MHFMTLGKTTAFQTRAFAIMLVVMAGSVTCGPASAQYWGDRSSGGQARDFQASLMARCSAIRGDRVDDLLRRRYWSHAATTRLNPACVNLVCLGGVCRAPIPIALKVISTKLQP